MPEQVFLCPESSIAADHRQRVQQVPAQQQAVQQAYRLPQRAVVWAANVLQLLELKMLALVPVPRQVQTARLTRASCPIHQGAGKWEAHVVEMPAASVQMLEQLLEQKPADVVLQVA